MSERQQNLLGEASRFLSGSVCGGKERTCGTMAPLRSTGNALRVPCSVARKHEWGQRADSAV